MRRGGRGYRKNHSPTTISSVLGATLPNLNLGAKLKEYRLKKLWPECVGKAIARHAAPVRIIGTVLFCSVESAPWMTELNYQKSAIIEKLNSLLGPETVTDIVFRTGQVKGQLSYKAPSRASRPVTPEEESFIQKTTQGIKDEKLKKLVSRVMRMGKE